MMTLGELIGRLEQQVVEQDLVVARGFNNPHSYRGYYKDVAFELCGPKRVSELLASAREALDATFQGWKGGDYTMTEHVDVYIAEVGCCGDELGELLLGFILRDSRPLAMGERSP